MLYGEGRESECELLAWHHDDGPIGAYTDMRVINAPLDLPDGRYTLAVESKAYSTDKWQGRWCMTRVELATA
jgi:hypothetical protein